MELSCSIENVYAINPTTNSIVSPKKENKYKKVLPQPSMVSYVSFPCGEGKRIFLHRKNKFQVFGNCRISPQATPGDAHFIGALRSAHLGVRLLRSMTFSGSGWDHSFIKGHLSIVEISEF